VVAAPRLRRADGTILSGGRADDPGCDHHHPRLQGGQILVRADTAHCRSAMVAAIIGTNARSCPASP
jgi:hypothetical protein